MNILSDKNVTARRKHRCMLCGGIIEKGESYNRQTVVYYGEIYDFTCHKHCKALMSLLDMDGYDDGVSENDFTIYVQDYVRDNHPDWDYMDIAACAKKIYEELKNED